MSNTKLTLPTFLKVLTSNNVPASRAMAVAAKIYKTHNTTALLAQLTDSKLKFAGVDDKEDRKLVLAAIRKAGYKTNASLAGSSKTLRTTAAATTPSGSSSSKSQVDVQGVKRKRRRDDDLNQLVPERPPDEGETYGSLEFNEILNEDVLMSKFTVVNRAPIMTAWSFVVAERLGFQREEALSIASVYTEMNAISKGVSLGIFAEGKQKGMEASKGGSQPYVDLMGRRPLYQTSSSHWRALSGGAPVSPAAAYSYITRSLRQTTPQIIGALRLLASSYSPTELNQRGYSLYVDFRPDVDGWGKKGDVKCSTILGLRKVRLEDKEDSQSSRDEIGSDKIVKIQRLEGDKIGGEVDEDEEPDRKKPRGMTLEEYEAALDADNTFNDVDLSFLDAPSNQATGDHEKT